MFALLITFNLKTKTNLTKFTKTDQLFKIATKKVALNKFFYIKGLIENLINKILNLFCLLKLIEDFIFSENKVYFS